MSTAKPSDLAELPKELLVHIVIYCNALSALRLSTTCQRVRSACYDKLIFRQMIARSAGSTWNVTSDRVEAAALRIQPHGQTPADEDVSVKAQTQAWARYALADYQASLLVSPGESPPVSPKHTLSWLPALAVLNHPVFQDLTAESFLHGDADPSPARVFCLAMIVLGSDHTAPQRASILEVDESSRQGRESACAKTCLGALCSAALTIRCRTARQRAVWPYGAMAQVPHIRLPLAADIPLSDSSVPPALPYQGHDSWGQWYQDHNRSLCIPEYFTSGAWCGYYIWFSNSNNNSHLDPPMLDIRFHLTRPAASTPNGPSFRLEATECRDGHDAFSISAIVKPGTQAATGMEGGPRMLARKVYRNGTAWLWDLVMTPFGLVGFWGSPAGRDVVGEERLSRNGMIWLWKEEWTKDHAG
ncbi:hypothetical protein LTR86_005755 [Recurvomyces mirabilis]|nr:hypothetical protein LTR86_005755 [Recurvomyces mirabilis]